MSLSDAQKIIKPKTQAGKRAQEQRSEKIIENTKTALFYRGSNTSAQVTQLLKDLYSLKKPQCLLLKQKNQVQPFEDTAFIEKMGRKYDASLFCFANHSKKRPHNLVFGRMFSYQILDMLELTSTNIRSLSDFTCIKTPLGTKPCLAFQGEEFDSVPELQVFKNLMLDFFEGPQVENIRLQGLEHLIQFSYSDQKILFRSYKVSFKKSGEKVPRLEVEEMGPRCDWTMRRNQLANSDLFKRSRRQPKEATIKKKKNIQHDPLGNKMGRIHLGRQDLEQLQLRKVKALKRAGKISKDKGLTNGRAKASH